VVEKLVKFSQ